MSFAHHGWESRVVSKALAEEEDAVVPAAKVGRAGRAFRSGHRRNSDLVRLVQVIGLDWA